jgi:hypothetical protein
MGAWLSHTFIAKIASPWILWLLVKVVTTPDEQYEQGPWLYSWVSLAIYPAWLTYWRPLQ